MTVPGNITERAHILDAVATDPAIEHAVAEDAWFVFNLSGGKDSGALAFAAMLHLDRAGHPRDRRLAIHADLGRAEWRSTPATVRATADTLGLPLQVVRRSAGDLVARWEVRFANALQRYVMLATYNLIGPWSQANKRFCTSELKAQVIGPILARQLRGETIVQVVGIRREESSRRRSAPISVEDARYAKPGNRHGTRMLMWNPGVHWTTEEVFDCHARNGIPLHEAYSAYGSTRLSCAFCIMGSLGDLRAAASAAGNADLYRYLVAMEATSTFSFQPATWLADVAPALLSSGLVRDIERAKVRADERRSIEAAMPPDLRYVRQWPPRIPSEGEARSILEARARILAHHDLTSPYGSAATIRDRFAELIEMRNQRAAA